MNKSRIMNWFTYTIVCALLPMLITFLVSNVIVNVKEHYYSGELLLFSVMVAATSLGDLKDFNKIIGKDSMLNLFYSVMLISLIMSAILYGCYVLAESVDINLVINKELVLSFSVKISAVIGTLGTIVQIIIAKSEGE